MKKARSGFTIVELLIVIVVIGILAAITIVAYNGIQTRAKNIKTVNAATQWVKAIKMYRADKGVWPNASCLGSATTYVGSNGQCWNDPFWTVKSYFLTEMQPYLSTFPEPDITDVSSSIAPPRRGIFFNTDGTTYWQLYLMQLGSGTCPNLGLTVLAAANYQTSGYFCIYDMNS